MMIVLFMMIILLLSSQNTNVGVTKMDPEKANQYGIRPLEGNPFYWQYRGKPTLLLGGTDQDTGEGDQSIKLDLSAAKGALTLRWLDVVRSAWQDEVSVQGGGRQQLKSPGDGQWVALIASEE